MQIMEMEVVGRSFTFLPVEVTAEPHHCLRKQTGKMHWCSAGVRVSKELAWPEEGLHLVFQRCLLELHSFFACVG